MVVSNAEAFQTANAGGGEQAEDMLGAVQPHPSGIPQDQIDNIMGGIANTGDVKMHNYRKKLRQR